MCPTQSSSTTDDARGRINTVRGKALNTEKLQMSKLVRSARGSVVDFELLAIKQQLASSPVPKAVETRKQAIDLKDGVKTTVSPDLDMLALAQQGAAESESAVARQLKRK